MTVEVACCQLQVKKIRDKKKKKNPSHKTRRTLSSEPTSHGDQSQQTFPGCHGPRPTDSESSPLFTVALTTDDRGTVSRKQGCWAI